jgi:ABC-type arginine transport system ATPase subunit
MRAQPVVHVEGLDVYYGTSQILFGVGLSVQQATPWPCSGAMVPESRRP